VGHPPLAEQQPRASRELCLYTRPDKFRNGKPVSREKEVITTAKKRETL